MKTTKQLICAAAFLTASNAIAQPEIENWLMNSGEYASYWENTTPQGAPTYVFNTTTVLANVTKVCYNSTYVWVQSDGMTTNMGQFLNPGAPTEQNYTYRFPRTSTVPGTKTQSPLVGSIGLLNNGVPVYGLSNAHYYNGSGNNGNGQGTWNVEVYLSEGFVLDSTLGAHPQQQGAYHSHAKPYRLYSTSASNVHSPIVGYAFDGYPIYGPYGYSSAMNASSGITRMKTGYSLRNITVRTHYADGTDVSDGPSVNATYPLGTYVEDYEWLSANGGDLDAYNGRFCVTPEYPSGTYAYFVTIDANGTPEFPYYIGPDYYGAPETDDITMGATITIPSSGVTCFTQPLAVIEPGNQENVAVAPNPSNGIFNLKLPNLKGTSQVVIFNMSGQEVYTKEIDSDQIQIDLSAQFVKGTYLIKVVNNGQSYYSKIALQ